MNVGKEIRPYKGVVAKNGSGTRFACSDSRKDDKGNWVKSPFYTIFAESVTCHIDEKNPNGIKIKVNSVKGVTLEEKDGKTYATIWSDDVEVIGASSVGESPVDGFAKITDEDIPF